MFCNSDVARTAFYHPRSQTCLATTRLLQVTKSFCRKWRLALLYATKSVYGTNWALKQPFFAESDVNPVYGLESHAILSNQKSVFRQLATTWFDTRQVWTWVVNKATSLFNNFFSAMLQGKLFKMGCLKFWKNWKILDLGFVQNWNMKWI